MQQIWNIFLHPLENGENLWNKVTHKIYDKKTNKHFVCNKDFYQEHYLKHINQWYGNLIKLYLKFIAHNCMIKAAKLKKRSKILDIGCGIGLLTNQFRKLKMDAIGVDVSKDAINHSIDKNCFHIKDSSKLNFPNNHFDLIVSREVLEHIPEDKIDKCIKEWDRISKGKMIHIIAVKERGKSAINDPAHVNVKTEEWWKNKFQEHNYKTIRKPSKLFFSQWGTEGYFLFTKK